MNYIGLRDIIPIDNQEAYKMHLACYNGLDRPLDVFVNSWDDWVGWNSWRGRRDDFNREYIFSLIDFYREADIWLFGGVFRVVSRSDEDNAASYKVELVSDTSNLVGRLKLRFKRPARAKSLKLERYYNDICVLEVLRERYRGEDFCGLDNINLDFRALQNLYRISKPDWKAALEHTKGVYLITDKRTAKRYVGAATSDSGVWSRWEDYIKTGHGGNAELVSLIKREGLDYARENFVFALLEHRSMRVDDRVINNREQYWKEVLLTRGDHGYNKN